jgi:hypothetical protein
MPNARLNLELVIGELPCQTDVTYYLQSLLERCLREFVEEKSLWPENRRIEYRRLLLE